MFGRKKNTDATAEQVTLESEQPKAVEEEHSSFTTPKGRPTPSQKERVAARRQPLVPTDRKAAKEANRQASREARVKEQHALQTGDERYLPARDKGKQRRYIRDFIDARFNVGDFMIVILLIIFIGGLFSRQLQMVSTLVMWTLILLWILDTWWLWRKLKKQLLAKFGELEPGSTMYAINRVIMLRRLRLPKPQVRRGEFPQ